MDADSPRLCLVLGLETPLPDAQALTDVLHALDAPTLVLSSSDAHGIDVASLAPLVKAAQAKGVAVLVENDCALAKSLDADGVHLSWRKDPLEGFEAARQALGPERIVGSDVGRSRHDAMEAGEAGADYVAFGIPAHVEDRETAFERQKELVSWWVELFEVPGVAFDVETAEGVAALGAAGADFIAVRWPKGEARPVEWAERLKSAVAAA